MEKQNENIDLILASGNTHKAKEISALLPENIHLKTLKDIGWDEDIEESGNSFIANAKIKARTVALKTGHWVLADDSGLECEALNGEPGVKSARYSGEKAGDQDNRNKLLQAMKGKTNRKARFVAVLVLSNGIKDFIFEGICKGSITDEESGSGGFGYDPVFIPEGYEESFAMMKPGKKNKISHRGKAMEALNEWLSKHADLLR
jgi:XTP/dITP diphosphohydrolase